GMGALELEGNDRALVLGGAEDAQRVDLAQSFVGVVDEGSLVRADARSADRIDIVDGGAKPDRLHDRRRAGLEFVRGLAVDDAVLEHLPDHLAAAVERRHGLEMLVLAVEHPDARRPVELAAAPPLPLPPPAPNLDTQLAP